MNPPPRARSARGAADILSLAFAALPLASLAVPWWQVWAGETFEPLPGGYHLGPGFPQSLAWPFDVVRRALLVPGEVNSPPAILLAAVLLDALAALALLAVGALGVGRARRGRRWVAPLAYLVLVGTFFAYMAGAATIAPAPSFYAAPSFGPALAVIGALGAMAMAAVRRRAADPRPAPAERSANAPGD